MICETVDDKGRNVYPHGWMCRSCSYCFFCWKRGKKWLRAVN